MLAKVYSSGVQGMDAYPVEVEVDLARGLFQILNIYGGLWWRFLLYSILLTVGCLGCKVNILWIKEITEGNLDEA